MEKKASLNLPYIWSFTTYFAEGLPYTIIRIVSSVFFRDMRVSLEAIGLTSLFGIPWVLKFLWGPIIDQFGTKRKWMLIMQFILVLLFISIAFLTSIPTGIKIIAVILFFGAIISATHDISIDGYYMEALDKEGQAKFVGYRVMAYRLAMMAGTGIIVTIGTTVGWLFAFFAAALLLGILFMYHTFLLPHVEIERITIGYLLKRALSARVVFNVLILVLIFLGLRHFVWGKIIGLLFNAFPILKAISFSGWIAIGLLFLLAGMALFKNRLKGVFFRDRESFYSRAFFDYIDRDKVAVAVAFIILMRTGESALSSMAAPFMVDLGIKVHYGWLSGGIGLPFSIIGAMMGGFCISKYSLRYMIWPFLLAQNLTNLVYMALALSLDRYLSLNTASDAVTFIGNLNLFFVACVHAFDQFAGGLGTSVLVTFLMRTCSEQFKAAHFAIGSGLMNISGVLSGIASGFLAERLGYGIFFGLTFLLSIPGMCLIFFVPFINSRDSG